MKQHEVKSLLGSKQTEMNIQGLATPDQKLEVTDVLVLYGSNKHIKDFLKFEKM